MPDRRRTRAGRWSTTLRAARLEPPHRCRAAARPGEHEEHGEADGRPGGEPRNHPPLCSRQNPPEHCLPGWGSSADRWPWLPPLWWTCCRLDATLPARARRLAVVPPDVPAGPPWRSPDSESAWPPTEARPAWIRPTASRGPCACAWRGWRGRRGCACAAGTRGSWPGDGCSAGRCACSRSCLPVSLQLGSAVFPQRMLGGNGGANADLHRHNPCRLTPTTWREAQGDAVRKTRVRDAGR